MRTLSKIWLIALVSISAYSCKKKDNEPNNSIDIPAGYKLVWNDEFNDDSVDPAKWTYEIGDGTDYGLPSGWGNNELQIYTSTEENSRVGKDGDVSALIITA